MSVGLRLGATLLSQARQDDAKKTWVYFIQESGEPAGAIKVGIARNPGKRLADLQVGNPTRLHLRSAFKAPSTLERLIHQHFADARLVGEWFENTDELEALADALRRFTVVEVTYEWDDLDWAAPLRRMEAA